ncbi:MAG: toll/interleukin-1 receptor domain-containing protein [Bacteroidales bacterium]|nr:toll/interleukin-1 receptor domain-containing protein [Bacteroidales bacterium]
MSKRYNVFISYRRVGFESANLISTKLKAMGYSVFFDMESLRSGKFNNQLYNVIDQCSDFVVVLPSDGLGRCNNEDGTPNMEDWVRKEVTYAMSKNKNIVPVLLSGFEWPNPMPSGLEELKNYQAVTANSNEYFDMAMQRLAGYLKSKKRSRVKLRKTLAIIIAIMVFFAALFCLLRAIGRPLCKDVAAYLASDEQIVHETYENVLELREDWDRYWDYRTTAVTNMRRAELDNEMLNKLSYFEKSNGEIRKRIPPMIKITPWQTLLLGLYGTLSLEIETDSLMTSSYVDDADSLSSLIRQMIESDPRSASLKKMIQLSFNLYDNSAGSSYASYLGMLSRFPSSAREAHEDLSKYWVHFPAIPQTASYSHYKQLVEDYIKKIEHDVGEMKRLVNADGQNVDELSIRLDSLEAMTQQVEQTKTNRDQDIAILKERVETKRQLVESMKAELSEEEQKVVDVYEQLKVKTKIEASEGEGYQWGKIIRMAKMLSTSIKNAQNNSYAVIKPQMVLSDLNERLDDYMKYHPEAATYVKSLKAYYAGVVKGQYPMGGQLIVAFKDNAEHPLYRIGDIIIVRNGHKITDNNSLTAATNENKQGTVGFLRMQSGTLVRHNETVPPTNVLVGYMEVCEY